MDGESGRGMHPVLQDLALLRLVPAEVRALVADCFEPVGFGFGEVIVRQGDPADAYYVLTSGRARVVQAGTGGEEVPLTVLGPGDGFGEIALLDGGERTATVRAASDVAALRLDRSVFQALLRAHPDLRRHVAASARAVRVADFLRLQPALQNVDAAALAALADHLTDVSVPPGGVLAAEGEPAAALWIVRSGRLRAYRSTATGTEDVGYLRAGDSVGARPLLAGRPSPARVEALDECRLLELGAADLARLLAEHPGLRAALDEHARREDRVEPRVPLDFAADLPPPQPAADRVGTGADARADPELAEDAPSDWGPQFRVPGRRIRRLHHVWQVDRSDCGAACLAMVARHHGRAVSLAHIRGVVFTSTDGTSLAGIAQGAAAIGFSARTVKASKSRLDELPLPAVVHWQGNHWVVLHDVTPTHVRVADPGSGPRRMRRTDFEAHWNGYAVLFAPTPALAHAPVAETTVRWALDFLRPHRRRLLAATVLAVLVTGLQMLLPVASQIAVDSVIGRRDRDLLRLLVLGTVGALLLAVVLTVLQRYLLSRAAVRIDGTALDFLSGRLLDLPAGYFATRKTGDIERRLAGLREVRQFVVEQGVQAITALTQLVVAVGLMVVYSWRLALVYLAAAPLYAALMRFSRRRLRPILDSLEDAFGEYQSHQIDAIKGIETVKAIGAEQALRRRLRSRWDQLAARTFTSDLTRMLYEAAISLVTFLSLAVFLWFGTLEVLADRMSVGDLVAFNALVLLANAPTLQLLSMWDGLQYASVLLNRINDVVEQEPEQGADRAGLTPVRSMTGRVQLCDVGFQYGGPGTEPVLEGLSLDVAAGTKVAIVGRSGSGKTTLVKCLAGLLVPTSGSIRYDGVDLRTLDHRQLRRHIGCVLQDNHLFDDTIAENIAFGEGEVDPERVSWAAGLANATEFIDRLPLGYHTRVGETGLRLSAGQRQRIAIARAIYRRPPLLILDEATSALDTESERAVKVGLDVLLEGRTCFVIAHRLSTVRDADLILVLEQGRIVERGTHDELTARQGLYHYLLSRQLG